MSSYVLSRQADADITAIARDSLEQWGIARAERYILELHEAFQRLAEFPDMGRNAGHIRHGSMQMATASHSVFYRETGSGILIVRVLHQRMDFLRHL